MAKKITPTLSEAQQVEAHMKALADYSLLKEMESLRSIIKKSSPKLRERIKWNAPSYYTTDTIVTFGPPKYERVLLVFHHPHIVNIKSDLLEGDYKDRRLAWFSNIKEIKAAQKELARILTENIQAIEKE
jgi:hypothetical protein